VQENKNEAALQKPRLHLQNTRDADFLNIS
jgi:hypothetical protein